VSPKKVTKPLDLYIRVSDVRGREGESFISPAEQEDRCRAAAAARGFTVGEVLTDLDVSGGSMHRPALNEARERIEAGVSGGIVVARIDRFGRTVARALDAIEEIDQAGGVIITAEGDFDTSTPTGELVLNLMLSLAQFELRRIRDNWQSAKSRAVSRGVHIAARIPPGYRKNGGGRLEPDGKNAETIKRAYAMVARGESYTAVSNYLNERGLPVWHPRKEGKGLVQEPTLWQANRVKRLLANRVYLGEARSGGEHVNAHAHKPLVSAETWTLAQRQKDRREPTARSAAPLAGLVRCASCRHAMRYQAGSNSTGNGGARPSTYRCPKHTAGGVCPNAATVGSSRLDEHVLEHFLSRLEVEAEQVSAVDVDADALVAEAVEAETAYKAVLEDAQLAKEIGPADHARMVATYKHIWETALAAIPDTRTVGAGTVNMRQLVADLQEAGNVDGLRELLASAIQAVFVKPAASRSNRLPIDDRVRIIWQGEEEIELPKRGETFGIRPYRF